MPCIECESAQADDYAPTLMALHDTRIAVKACDRHIREIGLALGMLNDLYSAAYQDAVDNLYGQLRALHTKGAD
jgi:hypothetical protein